MTRAVLSDSMMVVDANDGNAKSTVIKAKAEILLKKDNSFIVEFSIDDTWLIALTCVT